MHTDLEKEIIVDVAKDLRKIVVEHQKFWKQNDLSIRFEFNHSLATQQKFNIVAANEVSKSLSAAAVQLAFAHSSGFKSWPTKVGPWTLLQRAEMSKQGEKIKIEDKRVFELAKSACDYVVWRMDLF